MSCRMRILDLGITEAFGSGGIQSLGPNCGMMAGDLHQHATRSLSHAVTLPYSPSESLTLGGSSV